MQIKGIPEKWKLKSRTEDYNVLGKSWMNSIANQIEKGPKKFEKRITIDLSNVSFVSAFDWLIFISNISRILIKNNIEYLNIDLVGKKSNHLIDVDEYNTLNKRRQLHSDFDIEFSDGIYQLSGALEALGTSEALSRHIGSKKLEYSFIKATDANFFDFYSHQKDRPTVFLGIKNIANEEDCNFFLEDSLVSDWRHSLRNKYHNSPIIETEEIWRSICHELSSNIIEHSDSQGFIFYRAVKPFKKNKIRWWCKNNFKDSLGLNWPVFQDGFLEICVSDSGNGFYKNLKQAYLKFNERGSEATPKKEDVISFAFDEFGTSKTENESWVFTRHALSRVLTIVAKYNGVLTLRSDGVEVIYISSKEGFKRKENGLGYLPTAINDIEEGILGSHIQILLPLYPEMKPESFIKRDSIFRYLPEGYKIDPKHARGHLVPILETIGFPETVRSRGEIEKFRNSCIKMNNNLREQHPPTEPFIFDFSGVRWEPPQFETFLYFLQNIIQRRLILLVEIEARLANDVKRLEYDLSKTYINKEIIGETSEKKFFETYNGINHIILGLDKDGKRYIFGLAKQEYEGALLRLIDSPDSIDGICAYINNGKDLDKNKSFIKSILTKENLLFELQGDSKWNCCWDNIDLFQQSNRIISKHFDLLAESTGAWYKKLYHLTHAFDLAEINEKKSDGLIKLRFNLPWQEEWRESFLESSKFLSRERYCDEVAQRLIYRLTCGLELLGKTKSLSEVKVLACVTAPSLMIAIAMHRWWPEIEKPIVVDLSYYILAGKSSTLPSIVKEGGIVIIQDILERGKVSGGLLDKLREQTKEDLFSEAISNPKAKKNEDLANGIRNDIVICALSLIKFNTTISRTRVTPINFGWDIKTKEILNGLPYHSILEIPSPKVCDPPIGNENDENLFWIEPRSLQPISYKHLRRDFSEGRDPYLQRRDEVFPDFDNLQNGCLFAAGHYVYGHRHYQVAIDIKKLLSGSSGREIAKWISDICQNEPKRDIARWERPQGKKFDGDVTFVLMPIHSQIHYLWPSIKRNLAQRGRRQLMSFLDATLFSGSRSTYRISDHFEQLLTSKAIDAIDAFKQKTGKHPSPLRLLIIDDAIASARSAETILLSISNRLNKIFTKNRFNIETLPEEYHPIRWIRYFAILNQMRHANHTLWHNMTKVGNPPIDFLLEEYAPFMGVPLFDEKDCQYCADRGTLKQLISNCDGIGAYRTAEWASELYNQMRPVAIDGPIFRKIEPIPIESGIDILGLKAKNMKSHPIKYMPKFADTAIWRFYKLMHLSYPIADILQNALKWWRYKVAEKNSYSIDQKREYERYRWAVIDWCLKNWPIVKANTARRIFIELIEKEIEHNTDIVVKFLQGCSSIYEDEYIVDCVKNIINYFEKLELQRKEKELVLDQNRIDRIERLEIGLTSFFLGIPELLDDRFLNDKNDPKEPLMALITELENSKKRLLGTSDINLINNLHTMLLRPKSIANLKWALNAVAEIIFRGRDPKNTPAGRHRLLPRVLHDNFSMKRTPEDLLLLGSGLSVFHAALEDISPYAYLSGSELDGDTVKGLSKKILEWLRTNSKQDLLVQNNPLLKELYDLIDLNGKFVTEFNHIFHEPIEIFKYNLLAEVDRLSKEKQINLDFEFVASDTILKSTVLCYVNSLLNILINHAIDPAKSRPEKHKSKIVVYKHEAINEIIEPIAIRILTDFDSLEVTNRKIFTTNRGLRELKNLEIFGAVVRNQEWLEPDVEDRKDFFACWEILIPSGYISKEE